ncbi:kinase-like domain-containing protein [Gymnopilus junonius]|uniref:Kinase-like domain-containing protein n=1 Tax=Gymnopilus junonius TaxID=109634 RepID=A0A9P5P2N5_GYMJU|nr:kinase-like domain-containing protein [Gymnopilus junonius]
MTTDNKANNLDCSSDDLTNAEISPSESITDAPLSNDSTPDLTTESGVRAYLAKTAFASTEIVPLLGGTANYVYRLILEKEYEGRKTLVLKHAKPYVKSWKALAFALERQIYEVAALRHVGAWLPKDSLVQVPVVHLFDEEEHVIIMDDAGADTVTLKAFMQQGRVSTELGSQIGDAVGTFLGRMHRWGKGNREVCDAVKGNTQAKTMSAWAFYGRLKETLDGTSTLEKLQDPWRS